MANNKSGCVGCLVWLVILGVIISFGQQLFKKGPSPSTSQPQAEVSDPEFDRLMKEGYLLSEQGDCKEALDFFQKALERQQNNSFALKASENMKACVAEQLYQDLMKEGYQQFEQEKYADAFAAFSKALEQRPKSSPALEAIKVIRYEKPMAFGLQLLKDEDYEPALVVFETILKNYPDDAKAKEAVQSTLSKIAVRRFQQEAFAPEVVPRAEGRSNSYSISIFLQTQLTQEGANDKALIIAERLWREHPSDQQAKQATLDLSRNVAEKYIHRLKVQNINK
ncbi:tetratricopeptide repeat protein [Almyronema epifaneia]|uniref:Tol-pal system YbgF family protein n=1 Tax=Almyronema epifaneia S1 TaxID=2991925 RepID=A0ABW6ICQ2_9CYAN